MQMVCRWLWLYALTETRPPCRYAILLQSLLLRRLLVTLYLVARLEIRPTLKADTAFGTFSHLRDVLLDVFEGGQGAWDQVSGKGMVGKLVHVTYHRRLSPYPSAP